MNQHVREALAALELFGQIVERRMKMSAFPRGASDQLDQRLAVDVLRVLTQRKSEAR
jgi:hypothetical protein